MRNTFKVLAGFLERFEEEVEGRELQEPTPEMETKLRDFARGKLRGPEQSEVLGLLKENPQLIARLAEEVKVLRNETGN